MSSSKNKAANGPIIVEKPFRVEITKTSRGTFSYSIKVAGNSASEILAELDFLVPNVEKRIREGWKLPEEIERELEKAREIRVEETRPKERGDIKPAEILVEEALDGLPWNPGIQRSLN